MSSMRRVSRLTTALERDICHNRYYHAQRILNELEPELHEYMEDPLGMDMDEQQEVDRAIESLRGALRLGLRSAKEKSRYLMRIVRRELCVPSV